MVPASWVFPLAQAVYSHKLWRKHTCKYLGEMDAAISATGTRSDTKDQLSYALSFPPANQELKDHVVHFISLLKYLECY